MAEWKLCATTLAKLMMVVLVAAVALSFGGCNEAGGRALPASYDFEGRPGRVEITFGFGGLEAQTIREVTLTTPRRDVLRIVEARSTCVGARSTAGGSAACHVTVELELVEERGRPGTLSIINHAGRTLVSVTIAT